MNRWLAPTIGLFLLFGALSPVRGDVAVPPPPLPEAKPAKIIILVDERVTAPRFVVPKTLMADKKGAGLNTTTIVAGLALTLAFVSGGLWLARRGKARAIVASVVTVAALALGTTALLADLPKPPRPPKGPVALTLPADVTFTGKVEVEFVEKGDDVKLLVKQAWVKQQKKGEEIKPPKTSGE